VAEGESRKLCAATPVCRRLRPEWGEGKTPGKEGGQAEQGKELALRA